MNKAQFHLSGRLAAVAAMVSPGTVIADIGTDHGYVPAYLVGERICPRAVAMDINEGPLRHARQTVLSCGLQTQIDLRLSDGLEKLIPGEADTVVIAGMGGALTIRILQAYPDTLETVKELVLAPQSEIARVRRWLRENGFTITDEDMIREDGKFYPVMKAVRTDSSDLVYNQTSERSAAGPGSGTEETQSFSGEKEEPGNTEIQGEELAEDIWGPVLLREKHPVLREYLQYSLRIRKEILASLQKGSAGNPRIKEIHSDINRIQDVLTYFDTPKGATADDGQNIF